jgi:hypothetical protein
MGRWHGNETTAQGRWRSERVLHAKGGSSHAPQHRKRKGGSSTWWLIERGWIRGITTRRTMAPGKDQ